MVFIKIEIIKKKFIGKRKWKNQITITRNKKIGTKKLNYQITNKNLQKRITVGLLVKW